MISFEPFAKLLKHRGITKYRLIEDGIISHADVTRMINGHNFTLNYINRLCKALDCQPQDIIRYVPDGENIADSKP